MAADMICEPAKQLPERLAREVLDFVSLSQSGGSENTANGAFVRFLVDAPRL